MTTPESEEDIYNEFAANFGYFATEQSRVAYLLMSIYAVNPHIWERFFPKYKPGGVLFANMLYGTTVFIYCRPSMQPISPFNRLMFSILGSMMFNYCTMQVYEYVTEKLDVVERPYLVTLLGFLAGRIMIIHFFAFMYHVDSRSIHSRRATRNSGYEQMYS